MPRDAYCPVVHITSGCILPRDAYCRTSMLVVVTAHEIGRRSQVKDFLVGKGWRLKELWRVTMGRGLEELFQDRRSAVVIIEDVADSANERLLQLTVRCHKRAGRWHNWHITLQALSRWECLAFWKLHVIGDRVQEDIWSATGCTTAFNFQLT